MGVEERDRWQTVLVLVPPGLAASFASVEPALLVAGGLVSLVCIPANQAVRAAAGGLAVGALSGPGLEFPVAWLALLIAAVRSSGARWFAVFPALAGLVWSVTWGVDAGLWPVSSLLATVTVALIGMDVGSAVPILMMMAVLGGIRAWRAEERLAAVPADAAPELAERYGAAWKAPAVVDGLIADGWVPPEATTRERARALAELGAPRLAFRLLGQEPMPTWERAAMLNQAGRVAASAFLGRIDGPDDPANGPGVVFSRQGWVGGGREVVPIWLDAPASVLVVRASGRVMLGPPQLEVQIAGQRLGPVDVATGGDTWQIPLSLGRGVHRLTVSYPNPYENHAGRARQIELLEVELR